MFNMMLTVRKITGIGSLVFILGLMLFVTACGKGPEPTSTTKATVGPAAKLAFTTQPTGGASGLAFDTQPVVSVQDAQGNLVAGYKGLIALTITPGTGKSEAKLFGAASILLKDGAAAYSYLSIDKAAAGYTLTASSGSLTPAVSAPFTILPGAPAKLAFSVMPSEGKAGAPLTPNPEVVVQDNNGNNVTNFEGSVTLSATISYANYSDTNQSQPTIEKYPQALSGTITVKAVNGKALFTNISSTLSRPAYTLTAVSDSLASAVSSYLTINPSDPVKLEFTIQPSYCAAGLPFEIQPKVAYIDKYENVVITTSAPITVSLTPGTGTPGAVLSGTSILPAEDASGGLSAFRDLSIDKAGTGYVLTATSGSLPPVKSEPFDVTAP
jgi:hypothetical protein